MPHLGVIQPGDVGEEPAGHIVAGLPAAQGDEVRHGLGEDLVTNGGVDPVEDLRHPVRDPVADLGGAAEQVAERPKRQRPAVLRQQVRFAAGLEGFDGLFGDQFDMSVKRVLVDGSQGRGVRGSVAGVFGAGRPQGVGAPLHHRPDGAGVGDRLLPPARVGGKALRVAENAARLLVADDQRGGHAGGQVHGDQGAELLAHALVGGVRMLGEVRFVQGNSVDRVAHGRGSRRCARRARYWVSWIRACMQDARSRASHTVSGVCPSRARASWTSSSG